MKTRHFLKDFVRGCRLSDYFPNKTDGTRIFVLGIRHGTEEHFFWPTQPRQFEDIDLYLETQLALTCTKKVPHW